MMSPRTSFLVWWGLPILCAGLGASIAAFASQGGIFGPGPQQIGPLMLVGGYFAAVGLLALIFRIRQSQVVLGDDRSRYDKPVEAAMVALCAPVLGLGIWVFASGFLADFGPSRVIAGKLETVDRAGAFGRSYGVDLDRTAAPLILECRIDRNCGSPVPLMRLKPGARMEVEVLNGRVLGIEADGRQLIDPQAQRLWRLLFGGAVMALLVVYTAGFIGAAARLLFGHDEPEGEDAFVTWNTR